MYPSSSSRLAYFLCLGSHNCHFFFWPCLNNHSLLHCFFFTIFICIDFLLDLYILWNFPKYKQISTNRELLAQKYSLPLFHSFTFFHGLHSFLRTFFFLIIKVIIYSSENLENKAFKGKNSQLKKVINILKYILALFFWYCSFFCDIVLL